MTSMPSRMAAQEHETTVMLQRLDAVEHALRGLLATLPRTAVEQARDHAYDSIEAMLAAANPGVPNPRSAIWYAAAALFGERPSS